MNNSFVAIDFETANSFRGSVCEVGLVRVIDGIVDDSFAVLVKPHADHSHFDGINVSIHGIHPTDVLAAEAFDTAHSGKVAGLSGAELASAREQL